VWASNPGSDPPFYRTVVPSHPDIFVVGDTAAVTDQPDIPGTAAPASQMGRYVGRLIAARVAGGPRHRHFVIATWAISPLSAATPPW
jgi:NADH dehydrogenase FAD-containing subunit